MPCPPALRSMTKEERHLRRTIPPPPHFILALALLFELFSALRILAFVFTQNRAPVKNIKDWATRSPRGQGTLHALSVHVSVAIQVRMATNIKSWIDRKDASVLTNKDCENLKWHTPDESRIEMVDGKLMNVLLLPTGPPFYYPVCDHYPPPASQLSMSSDSHPTLSAVLSEVDALLFRFGSDIMDDVVFTIVECIFCSAYSIFFAIAVYSIFRKGLKSRASIVMLCVVVYLYASSVAQWAVNVWTVLQGIHSLLMVPGVPIADRPDLANANLAKSGIPMQTLWVFSMIVGDSVVVWRTWAVYMHRVLAILIPSILLFMSLIFGLIDLGCMSYGEGCVSIPAVYIHPLGFIGWVFSVATNVACTVLIGLKARKHRKITRQLDLTAKSHRMSANKILSLLVESGAIYSLLWLTQVIAFIGGDTPRNSPLFYLWTVLRPIGNQMGGLYPTLIIVIVNFRQTIWDDEPATVHIDSLHWAPNSNRSRMSNTLDTQRRDASVHSQSVINITNEEPMAVADKNLGLTGDYEV
ncbi:hypothetical protein C8R45DRAFT_1180546 [Mycena sanguinolenta]|nr:hypothetical protein C8R45DRAFT_1180546 [Mycena sanguinolenta]